MDSSTLFPAVLIFDSQNVYSRAEGIADHYWAWTVFLSSFSSSSASSLFPLPLLFPIYAFSTSIRTVAPNGNFHARPSLNQYSLKSSLFLTISMYSSVQVFNRPYLRT